MHHIPTFEYFIEMRRKSSDDDEKTGDKHKAYNTLQNVYPNTEIAIKKLCCKCIHLCFKNSQLP